MQSRTAKVFVRHKTLEARFLPEGPRSMRVAGRNVLVWVNIQSGANAKIGTIFGCDWEGGRGEFEIPCPGRVGFILPIAGGDRALLGVEKGLRICNLATGEWSEPLATLADSNPRTLINDAEIVPGGKAVVFGTKDTLFRDPIANLYLYTVDDNRLSLLADGQLCSNGKVFHQDDRGTILLDIDTPTRKVVRYRLDSDARIAARDGAGLDLGDRIGFPDGMCDCGDGTVIVAFYNPEFAETGRATRFDLATGRAVEEWLTPGSPRVTCPLVANGKLILTTAIEGMPDAMLSQCPNAGCSFAADVEFPSMTIAELFM